MLDIQARDLCILVQALGSDVVLEEDSEEAWDMEEGLAGVWVSAEEWILVEVEDGEWAVSALIGIIRR